MYKVEPWKKCTCCGSANYKTKVNKTNVKQTDSSTTQTRLMSVANSQDISSVLTVIYANVKVSHLLAQDTSQIKQHGDASICYEHKKHEAKTN